MDTQQQLFGLMAVAEEHQKAVKVALEGLAAEREALAKERAAVERASTNVVGLANDLRRTVADTVPAVKKAVGEAIGAEVKESANKTASDALEAALRPVANELASVTKAASNVKESLNDAAAAAGWKWAVIAIFAVLGLVMVVGMFSWLAIWWQRSEIETLTEQKAALQQDISQLQADVAQLEKKGGRIQLSQCGPKKRLCIEVTPDQGGKTDFVGSWVSKDSKQSFVIPKGY